MITIFHLSDLHIDPKADNHQWERMKKELLDIAREQSNEQQRILIVTGDFHNYADADYQKAYDFLIELTDALGLERKEDLFVIPGNHDVGSEEAVKRHFSGERGWKTPSSAERKRNEKNTRQREVVAWLKTNSSDDSLYKTEIEKRLEAYQPYCKFVRSLGLYEGIDDELYPARVHVRCWRSRLNILHLNTTLVAAGKDERSEQVDIKSAEGDAIWQGRNRDFPALALGHHSFFDLNEAHQNRLKSVFRDNSVCAYLCGDTHKVEEDPNRQRIDLNPNRGATELPIPNVVGAKGAASAADAFSDFGLYVHQWDEDTDRVRLKLYRWLSKAAQPYFRIEDDCADYYMPRPNITALIEGKDQLVRILQEQVQNIQNTISRSRDEEGR